MPEKSDETRMTVRLRLVFPEGSFVELAKTEYTDEVFGVESLSAHCSDTAACDWLRAAHAKRAPSLVVVDLTERVPFELKKVPTR